MLFRQEIFHRFLILSPEQQYLFETVKHLIKYFNKRKSTIDSILKKSNSKYNSKTIHKLRIEIKKLNALFDLIYFCENNFKQKKTFEPLKFIFRQAGKVRELQLEEEMIEEQQPSETDEFMPEGTIEYEEREQIQEVEPIAEFDEVPATTFDEVPSATLVDRIEEEEALQASRAVSAEGNPFTYHNLFADHAELSSLMTQLESQITSGQYASCVLTARAAYAPSNTA